MITEINLNELIDQIIAHTIDWEKDEIIISSNVSFNKDFMSDPLEKIDNTIVRDAESIEFPVGAPPSPAVPPSATVKDEVPETDDLTTKSTPPKITISTPDPLSVGVVPKAPVPEKPTKLTGALLALQDGALFNDPDIWFRPFHNYKIFIAKSKQPTIVASIRISETYQEAMNSPEAPKWMEAMNLEIKQKYWKKRKKAKKKDIQYHHIRDLVEKDVISVSYIPSKQMAADGFTKALDKEKFIEFREMIGMAGSIATAEWDTGGSTGCFLVLRPKTMKIFKSKNTRKREEKGKKANALAAKNTL